MPRMPGPKRPKTSYGGRTKSVTTLKKKIRDVQRILSRAQSTLSAQARVESERALAAYKLELTNATRSRKEQKNAKKYHMVRFFERQKATRRLNKLQREAAALEGDAVPDDLAQKIHNAQVELNYTLYYPRGEKYISLFKDPGNNQDVIDKRDAIKQDIAKRMKDNALGARTMDRGDEEEGEEEAEAHEVTKPKKRKQNDGKAKEGEKKKRNQEPEKGEEEGEGIENDDFFEF
ncbi:hypothetical protein FN846DRAFT_256501 [Sphaerosporella brunnea]|uniref:rRNA-processing protein EFG1 n=1 Tax=Sphaerosporella brunnea TaxID=1250544 RepID=A0A5J5F7L3_9PEZI|nr:hypothetical protein FN846DRAFT_256501 [Sphaerosporella brunnea]